MTGRRWKEAEEDPSLTFMSSWNEILSFRAKNWRRKHNNEVLIKMGQLLLDVLSKGGSAVYNWRLNPVIPRGEDGTIARYKVTYVTPGFQCYD